MPLLRVYSDAEHELTAALTREVDKALRDPEAGDPAHRAAYIARLRTASARVVAGLEHGNRARVRAVVDKAATAGRLVAARDLARASGRNRPPAEEAVNLGALDHLAAAIADNLTAAHSSILRTTPDVFRDVMGRATVGLSLGTQTRRQAAQRAMWEYTRRGITSFTDKSGRQWELSSYAEMATRTAGARAAVDAQLDHLARGGQDLVQVSDHHGECYLCRPWEGKVLSISGAPGYTSVAYARENGLLHPNCRHTMYAYLEGYTRAPSGPGTGPDPEGEKARDRQRAIERQIRAWKRNSTAALDPQSRRYANAKVKAWQAEMREHLDHNPDLKRQSHRESPGAGNLPTAATERDNPGGPFPDRNLRPAEMDDEQLDVALAEALDLDDGLVAFDKLTEEADRRDVAKHADEARRADARNRAAARKERADEAQALKFERMLDDGTLEEDAIAAVYGISVERQRKDAVIRTLRADGFKGRGFDELSRDSFRDRVRVAYDDAEDATNGYMLNKAGQRAGIDPRSLFVGDERRARKYASEELRAWWDIHGRPTLAEHRADLIGDPTSSSRLRAGRGDFLA